MVIAVICVLGTVETVFWIKVGWRWWKGESQDDRVGDGDDQRRREGYEEDDNDGNGQE